MLNPELKTEMEGLVQEDDKAEVRQALIEAAETLELRGLANDTIINIISPIVYALRDTYGD